MKDKFTEGVLNLNIENSMQIVLDNYLHKDTSITLFNEPKNKSLSYKNQYSIFEFSSYFNKKSLQQALKHESDYLILFNLTLNDKQLELIGFATNLNIGVILVCCKFDINTLQNKILDSEFFKINSLHLKEKIEHF
jgi:hypothetical protein